MNAMHYRILSKIDAPKRFLTLTIDELLIAMTGFALLVASNHKVLASLLSLSLLTATRYLKKGEGPKVLLVLAYWYLPAIVTRFFLPRLPASHQRLWTA